VVILCREGWRRGSYQITMGFSCCILLCLPYVIISVFSFEISVVIRSVKHSAEVSSAFSREIVSKYK